MRLRDELVDWFYLVGMFISCAFLIFVTLPFNFLMAILGRATRWQKKIEK